MKRRSLFASAVLFSAVLGAGCAITNETTLLTGKARPPTTAEQVKLYSSPPKRFEEIAIVTADAAHDFMQKQALLDTAVLNAKKEAAKVGANGLLLDAAGDFVVGSTGVVTGGARRGGPAIAVGTFNNRTGKQIAGKAIYVIEE